MTAVATGFLDSEEFAVGRCPECRRDVLSYPHWSDERAGEVRRCVHCDGRLSGELRPVEAGELGALGYELAAPSTGGSGCVSCVRGGCGVKAS